jgi:predicted O-methyltransferase YrrM
VTRPVIQIEHDAVEQALLPGLPAASYYSDDVQDLAEQFDVFCFQRRRYRRDFGFCLFTAECLLLLVALCKGKKVLEAGSGSGWLANHLAQNGVEITAADWTDYRRSCDKIRGYPMRSVFRLDHHGDAVTLLPDCFDIVLLVWPNLDTPFGEHVAHAMISGQIMIFEGERKGGCTANDEFFNMLSTDFEFMDVESKALNEHHRTFPCLQDQWLIFRKL